MKKVIAFILCIAMMLSLCAAAFAETESSKGTVNYVSIGSSQTLGVGLYQSCDQRFLDWKGTEEEKLDWAVNGWNAGTWNPEYYSSAYALYSSSNSFGYKRICDKSFPVIVKKEIENQGYYVNFSQLAISGFRADDFAYVIDENVPADEFTERFLFGDYGNVIYCLLGMSTEAGFKYFRNEYQTAIKNADLITYDAGANNFGYYITVALDYGYDNFDYTLLIGEDEYDKFSSIKNKLQSELYGFLSSYNIPESATGEMETMINLLTYALIGYCVSLDRTVKYIYENNPDVVLVINQILNCARDLVLSIGDVDIPFGEMVNIPISIANLYAASLSEYSGKYYYSRLSDEEKIGFITEEFKAYEGPEDLNSRWIEMIDGMDGYVHIKSQLTPVYSSLYGSVYLGGKYDQTLTACYDATMKFLQYIYNECDISLLEISSGDASKIRNLTDELVSNVAVAIEKGDDYLDAVEAAKESFSMLSSADQTAVAKHVKLFFGMALMNHPNEDGARLMAEAVINAVKSENKGFKSICAGYKNAYKDFSNTAEVIANSVEEIVESDAAKSVIEAVISKVTPVDEIKEIQKNVKTVVEHMVKESESMVKRINDSLRHIFVK